MENTAPANTYCKNCNCRIDTPSHSYCPYCGQKYLDKLTLTSLFYNAINGFFSFDSKLKKTILPFLFKPGMVARKFIDGKRQTYLHPVQIYVFSSFIFLLLLSQLSKSWGGFDINNAKKTDGLYLNLNDFTKDDSEEEQLQAILDTLEIRNEKDSIGDVDLAQQLDSLYTVGAVDSLQLEQLKLMANLGSDVTRKLDSMILVGATNEEIMNKMLSLEGIENRSKLTFLSRKMAYGAINFYRDNGDDAFSVWISQLSIVSMLMVPLYAIFLLLFHIRRNKSFAENLSHAFFLFSFVFLFCSLLILIRLVFGEKWNWLISMFFILPPIYFLLSFITFYKQGFFKAFIKLSIISFFFGTFMIVFGSVISILLTLLKYS